MTTLLNTPLNAPVKQQQRVNPFYYINGTTINPIDNSNPQGTIQIKRTYNILEDGTQWDVAIIRATYPLNSIPLGIFPITSGSVNQSPMACSMTRASTSTNLTTNAQWSPEFTDALVPSVQPTQDLSTKYYFYTTIASALRAFNAALATSATSLSVTAPFFTFDPVSNLFSLFLPTANYGSSASTPIVLSWNAQWAQYFPNFSSTSAATVFPFQAGQVYPTIPTNPTTQTINGVTYIQLIQECPNVTQWDSLSSIQMTTDLGIVAEDTAVVNTSYSGAGNAVNPQLTDILVDAGSGQLQGGSRSGVIEYLPTSIPRWINMRTGPFSAFNIFLTWISKSGTVFPMILPPGTCATMKVLFRHRGSQDTY